MLNSLPSCKKQKQRKCKYLDTLLQYQCFTDLLNPQCQCFTNWLKSKMSMFYWLTTSVLYRLIESTMLIYTNWLNPQCQCFTNWLNPQCQSFTVHWIHYVSALLTDGNPQCQCLTDWLKAAMSTFTDQLNPQCPQCLSINLQYHLLLTDWLISKSKLCLNITVIENKVTLILYNSYY